MKIGSLCSGIGGLELGLERAGVGQTIWQCETDPYASRVLAKHWPGVPNHGDITTIDWSTVERPDIICAGYPCQPFSSVGSRDGHGSGTRSPRFRPGTTPRENLKDQVRRLTGCPYPSPDLSEWLMGYRPGWTVIDCAASETL